MYCCRQEQREKNYLLHSTSTVEDEDDAGGDDSAKKLVQSNAPPMEGQSATSGVRTSRSKSIGNKQYVSFFGPNSGTSILPGQGVLTQKWNVLFGSQNYFLLSLLSTSRFCHSSPRVDMLPPSRSTFTCPNFLQVTLLLIVVQPLLHAASRNTVLSNAANRSSVPMSAGRLYPG